MANLNVTGNFSTSSNSLHVRYTTDAQNITKMEITKDNTNFITADSFTNSDATFNVSTWDNGTYACKLRMTHIEATPGGSNLLDSTGAYVIDDFTGTSLDSSKWSYELGHVRNNELQNYTNTNDVVSDGLIALRGLKDGSGNWTSSSIISVNKFTFMYGRIEARIKADISPGSFSAFWTLGDCFEFDYVENGEPGYLAPLYPDSGEFDVMEYYNGKLTCGIYLDDGTEVGRTWYTDYNANEWHTYAMEWHEDGSMKLYIDDHLISSTSASDNSALHIPHYILLNQAIGAAGGTPDSNDTEITQYVDWVKYYPLSTDNLSLYSTDFNLHLASQYDDDHAALVRVTYNDNCINKVLNWSSSNSTLLSVHNGFVTTHSGANGSAVITATSNTGVSRSITLYVSNGVIRDTSTTPTVPAIVLNNINNITVNKGEAFNILYSTNIPAVKHEISWNGGSEYWDKTSEITVSDSTNYKYTHEAKTDVSTYSMAIRVTDAKGNTSTKTFTITFNEQVVNNFTFTQYKTLDENGNVVATDDATYYSTVNLNAVEAGTNYTITLNSGNYILVLFYDSNGNGVDSVEVNTPDWSYQAGFSTTFTVPANASHIRVLATNNSQVTGTLTKESAAPTVPAIALNTINNMIVDRGQTFNILYSSNISAVKHEISWDGGSTFWDKTSEIITEHSTNYKYTHEAKTDVDSYNMAIRVTDAKGNTSTKTFTITFTGGVINNFTFTKNKRLDNGIVTDSEDGTYYTTVNKNSVTSGTSYTISVNSANYMCICFYDSNDNYLGNDTGGYIEAHTDDWSVKALSTTFTVPSGASYLRVTATGNETQVTGTLTNNGSSTPSVPGSNLLDSNGAYLLDDFSGSSVDRSKWDYELGYVRNSELQNYTSTNTEVNNSILALKGIKDSNGNWTSASIISKGHFAFMYGKIECRAKIDPTWGSFSAFWTLGDSFEFGYHDGAAPDTLGEWWAYCGEFDVMEFYSGKLTCGTFFNEREESGRVWYNNYDFNAWHTFAMEWLEDGTLIFSIDGNELSRTSATNNRAFHIPHFILINQAIGASGGTPADSTTAITQYVDWVKYYPASTSNVVLYTSNFSIAVTDRNDSAHNCVVRATFHDNCINKVLSWSSSNSSLVWVHSGLCSTYAGANGTVNITATSPSGVSQTIQLNVVDGKIQ